MTKRDFFILAIKLFGLYFVIHGLFFMIPYGLSPPFDQYYVYTIILNVISIIFIVGLFVLLLFKSGKIVKLLKLEKGFDDERIEIGNLHAQDVVKIGTFIIGGLIFIENIPSFLSHSFFALKGEIAGKQHYAFDKFGWAISGFNVVIGYLLLTNFDFIAKKLEKEINQSKD